MEKPNPVGALALILCLSSLPACIVKVPEPGIRSLPSPSEAPQKTSETAIKQQFHVQALAFLSRERRAKKPEMKLTTSKSDPELNTQARQFSP